MDANDTSCFFSADGPTLSQLESLTIIEGSSSGLCDLFILERDGRRRVLKCLKLKYRGLPAYEEWTELRSADNCTWVYTTVNEVNGYLVTSNVNGNSIFLPSAGYKGENGHLYDGERGRYWAATINTESDAGNARSVNFDSDRVSRSSYYRYFGRSIRPVCD